MIIELPIGRSLYKINCNKGEEDKFFSLAERLNQKVNKLSLSLRDTDEKTLLVIAALSLEETIEKSDISDAENILNNQDIYNAISDNMENVTNYIEKLIRKIQAY